MRYRDYIPLAQTPSATATTFSDDPFDHVQPPRKTSRRRLVLATGLVVTLVLVYVLAAELSEDIPDLYLDDPDLFPDSHAAYIPFEPPNLNTSRGTRLTPTQVLPDHCRDAFFSSGALCFDPVLPRMDVVWTWVNGSDPLLQAAKLEAESRFASDDSYRPKTSAAQARQYRDNDELRHSMRSVLDNFMPFIGRFHIITSDFAIPETTPNLSLPETWRLGQVPQWLDMSNRRWVDGDVELDIIHHAQIFKPYPGNNFNSYAIEAQFGNLPGVSEHFVYLNDDFFMSNPLTPRTFYTSPYGMVLRFDLGIMVSPEKPAADEDRGEWRSMGESNVLLSQRFGARYRPYVLHEAKAASMSIIRELSAMWGEHFERAATHPFRETVSGAGDVSMLFLMVHFLVERWREALLWTWTVGKHGGLADEWDEDIMQNAWLDLGGDSALSQFTVRAVQRGTLEDDRIHAYFRNSGHKQVDKTFYISSSQDGYPYMYIDEYDHEKWQDFRPSTTKPDDLPECTINFDECFTHDDAPLSSASEVFKHVAFRRPACGDCIIHSLVAASGPLGLEAFLPSPARTSSPQDGASLFNPSEVPHLSLSQRWEDGQFSLRSVLGFADPVNIRAWSLRLLERYRFVVGYTPYIFVMLETQENTEGALSWIDWDKDASLLCINDDVKEGEEGEGVSDMFQSWQEHRWGRAAGWERPPGLL